LSSYLEFFTKNSTLQPTELNASYTENFTSQPKELNKPSFTELLIASNSDKYWRHHYEHYYEEWLKPFRDVPNFTMMEIGVQRGASLGLWAEYFTYPSKIWGMAYDTEGNIQKARSKLATEYSKHKGIVDLFLGDQGNITNLQETARTKGPFDIILDDGSHLPEHMVLGLFYLWGSIKPGGLYIVEDLETNYWTPGKTLYGYKFENTGFGKGAAVEKFKQLLDLLPSRQLGVKQGSMSILPGDDDLCCVLWGKNLVAFQKCSQKQKETPPKQNQLTYDIAQAQEWLKEAKATNPKEFQ